MASRLSLTEVLEAVLDDHSDDFSLSEDESSEGEDESISAYAGQRYMNPEEVSFLGRVVAQESDNYSDFLIYLTDSEAEAEAEVSKTIGFPPFFIVFVFFFIFCSVPCHVCDVTVCSSCECCVVGQNPSQISTWCPMVTAQLANMTGDTYFLVFILF